MKKGYKLAYIRVSTLEQNEARQIEELKSYDIDKTYIEKLSGKDRDRPQLKELLDYARENDTIYITDFSRLARNTKDLLDIVEELEDKGVKLISLKENLDTSTPTGKLLLTMLGAIYDFERTNLLERQKAGIEIAKRNGVYKGRKAKKIDSNFKKHYQRYLDRQIESKTALAKVLNISRTTLYRLIAEYETQLKTA